MGMKQIVAAVVDSVIITDTARIDAYAVLGRDVRYVSRREARRLAIYDPQQWAKLAVARTLYLIFEGQLLRSI